MRNTFGNLFTLTSFGESHGVAVGGVVDGMPAGVAVDEDFLQRELDRRRPGQSGITTQRKEPDRLRLLSGVFGGVSTGAPIGFVVENRNQRPQDYANMKDLFRPSHADYTYYYKYGVRDYRGGGRASARITISRVVAGALAKLALRPLGVAIRAYTSQVGSLALGRDYHRYDLSRAEDNPVRCPDDAMARRMEELIREEREAGDTIGGVVTCIVSGCPVGLGEPEFGKLQAQLAAAMLSINAAKGFEYGDGFDMASRRGSEVSDLFSPTDKARGEPQSQGGARERGSLSVAPRLSGRPQVAFLSNHSGGIQGGISNGEDICFRVAFKPVATLLRQQPTVDIHGRAATLEARGRHDPCVVPRAVPIVEAMAAMVILDNWLLGKTARL